MKEGYNPSPTKLLMTPGSDIDDLRREAKNNYFGEALRGVVASDLNIYGPLAESEDYKGKEALDPGLKIRPDTTSQNY